LVTPRGPAGLPQDHPRCRRAEDPAVTPRHDRLGLVQRHLDHARASPSGGAVGVADMNAHQLLAGLLVFPLGGHLSSPGTTCQASPPRLSCAELTSTRSTRRMLKITAPSRPRQVRDDHICRSKRGLTSDPGHLLVGRPERAQRLLEGHQPGAHLCGLGAAGAACPAVLPHPRSSPAAGTAHGKGRPRGPGDRPSGRRHSHRAPRAGRRRVSHRPAPGPSRTCR
jgi:hypothetical protein